MGLRDRRAGKATAPIVVMALRTGKVELTLAAEEGGAAGLDKWFDTFIVRGRDRHITRLARHVGGQGEQFLAFESQSGSLLPVGAADIDLLLEIYGAPTGLVKGRIASSDPLHGTCSVAMTIGAGFVFGPGLAVPGGGAVQNPQHAGIGGVVVLHAARFAPHEFVTGLALGERNLSRDARDSAQQQQRGDELQRPYAHSTVIFAVSVTSKPLSPLQVNSSMPLSVATVKNDMNGLAATAGNRSARMISWPLYLQVNRLIMSRGICLPTKSWR